MFETVAQSPSFIKASQAVCDVVAGRCGAVDSLVTYSRHVGMWLSRPGSVFPWSGNSRGCDRSGSFVTTYATLRS